MGLLSKRQPGRAVFLWHLTRLHVPHILSLRWLLLFLKDEEQTYEEYIWKLLKLMRKVKVQKILKYLLPLSGRACVKNQEYHFVTTRQW